MNLKTLMIIKAVICITFGCLLLLVPGFTYSLFGASLNDAGVCCPRVWRSPDWCALFNLVSQERSGITSTPSDHLGPIYL